MNNENSFLSKGVRQINKIHEYKATCGVCHLPVYYADFLCLVMGRTEEGMIYVAPFEYLICPHCSTPVGMMEITEYISLNPQEDLKQ
jgi:hypothetical protein